jgi:putative ABC transport system substrate-binding protein
MWRRGFIASLAGATALRSFRATAQPTAGVRRVGVLTGLGRDDPATKARLAAFRASLEAAGWVEGRNLRIDTRFAPGTDATPEAEVADLLSLEPEVLVIQAPGMPAALAATRTVPIVFVLGGDPAASGWVQSLAHPGGNVTGFTAIEPGFGSKWLQLLTQIAPSVRRVLVVEVFQRAGQAIAAAADQFGVEVVSPNLQSIEEIEAAITDFARTPQGGLIVPTDAYTASHRKPIIDLAMRHRLPLVSGNSPFPQAGGLLYYGPDPVDLYRRSATYVDRILRGERPADLPVQQPTKFSMIVNLKTAKALDIVVPPLLLAEADEVIE